MTTYRPTLDEDLRRPMPPSRKLLVPLCWPIPRLTISLLLRQAPREDVRRRCMSVAWEVQRRPWRRSVRVMRMARAQQQVLARRLLLRVRLEQDRQNARLPAIVARLARECP